VALVLGGEELRERGRALGLLSNRLAADLGDEAGVDPARLEEDLAQVSLGADALQAPTQGLLWDAAQGEESGGLTMGGIQGRSSGGGGVRSCDSGESVSISPAASWLGGR